MKKLTVFLLSGVLMFGAAACTDKAKTAADAPSSTNNTTQQAPKTEDVKTDQKDAQSEVRRAQLNADIKACEERNNTLNGGSAQNKSDHCLATEVRSKLEANIPNGQLTVKADKGNVTVAGTVVKQDQVAKIAPLAKQIKGVKGVNVNVKAAPAKS